MYKKLSLLAAAAGIAFAGPALAEDKTTYTSETKVEKSASGDYEKKTKVERKDPSGMESLETKTNIDVDADGDVEKTVETKQVNDPKGLMNKQTVKTEDKEIHQDGKVTTKHTKKVNGKVVEDTESHGGTSPAR
jgi:hypothetical protein